MSIVGSDPFIFLTSQGGVVGTPLTEAGASGADNLDSPQRSAVIGEPIPIVFCRRVSNVGGVLISPPATEARFEDDASSNITASYHLVLSEGQIDSIEVRDVFQRACRVGSYTQTYSRRAGTFIAGNFIDNTPNLEAPYYCGTSGTYDGLSTLAFSVTIPAGFDQWNRQVHCFIRGGIYVPRLLDSITGPSNNVADLLLYLLRNSSRVPDAMIDTASLLAAATFTNVNGFWFNGVVSKSTNLRDWIRDTLQYFLLRQARVGGKEALKPLVQANANGTIKTTAVTWAFTFTEEHVIPDSFSIIYTPLADRKPFCATVLWRQQDDLGIPVMRTAEVRYTGTAVDGPYEQHDLSSFCSSEDHAVKVGAYILSKRRHISHRLQLGVKPDAFNSTLTAGDIVRVRLERVPSSGPASLHDYLYEVDRIGKSLSGEVSLDLTHFPVDADLISVVAQEVNSAVGTGLLLPTGLSGVTCDVNFSGDTSIPAETFTDESFPDYGTEIDDLGGEFDGNFGNDYDYDEQGISFDSSYDGGNFTGGSFGGSGGGFGRSGRNSRNSLGRQSGGGVYDGPSLSGVNDPPRVGDTVSAPTICEGGLLSFYRLDPSVPGGKVLVPSASSVYTLTINDIDYSVYAEVICPDPSSPTGYSSDPISYKPTPTIIDQADLPSGNVSGTYSPTGTTNLTIYGGWSGQRLVSSVCTNDSIQDTAGGTANILGVVGFRVVQGGASVCGGYGSLNLQVQNAAGTWTSIAGVGGGGVGWKQFIGYIVMSSTAPDARNALLGNFGGSNSAPPF